MNCFIACRLILVFLVCEALSDSFQDEKKYIRHSKLKYTQQSNENFKYSPTNQVLNGPRCIPLTSKNIEANPYHPALLSLPGRHIRNGFGLPILKNTEDGTDMPITRCPDDTSCKMTITKSFTTSIFKGYSISLSEYKTYGKFISNGTSMGSSNSYAESMGKALDQSHLESIDFTDESAFSDQISQSISNTHEKSSGYSQSTSNEMSNTIVTSSDTAITDTVNSQNALSHTISDDFSDSSGSGGSDSISVGSSKTITNTDVTTISVTVEVCIPLIIVSVCKSHTNTNTFTEISTKSSFRQETNEENWSSQQTKTSGTSNTKGFTEGSSKSISVVNGKSNADTKAHSSSSTNDLRITDSISASKQAAKTDAASKKYEKSLSKMKTESYRVDDTFQSAENSRKSNNGEVKSGEAEGIDEKSDETITHEFTYTIDDSFELPAGACKMAVCLPFVKAVPIPFECIKDENIKDDKNQKPTFYADYIFDFEKTESGKISCATSLIDCSERSNPHIFQLDNFELENADSQNSLKWGKILTTRHKLVSKNNDYKFELLKNGELTLTQGRHKIWSNQMGIFIKETKQTKNINNIRVRINEKGHLIEEVKGHLLFSNFNNNTYRSNEWVVVWSSAPIHHNVTIGIFKTPDNHKSYRMVLEESGNLMLYDAVGALIWCTASKCNHRFGYQFPEVY